MQCTLVAGQGRILEERSQERGRGTPALERIVQLAFQVVDVVGDKVGEMRTLAAAGARA
jgi:hypothetical protein